MIAADADTIRAMKQLGPEPTPARAIADERGCSVRAVQLSLGRLRDGGVVAQVGDRWAARWVLLVPHEQAHAAVRFAVLSRAAATLSAPRGDPP